MWKVLWSQVQSTDNTPPVAATRLIHPIVIIEALRGAGYRRLINLGTIGLPATQGAGGGLTPILLQCRVTKYP